MVVIGHQKNDDIVHSKWQSRIYWPHIRVPSICRVLYNESSLTMIVIIAIFHVFRFVFVWILYHHHRHLFLSDLVVLDGEFGDM